ncbi:MAG: signal peptidase II [Thermoguttaceae bacterium]|nr:signal peptidase II [Thermoguttaceae bacterium]
MKHPKSKAFRTILFLAIAAFGFIVDIWTKHWIFAELGRPGQKPVRWIIDGVFGFQTSLNQGALFGMGQGKTTLFVVLSIVALVGVAWWVWADLTRSAFLSTTLGLIAAGILGNLWDRVGMHRMAWTQFDVDVWGCKPENLGEPIYAVRDWILVMIGKYPWPNFNIADSCLVCGAILVGIYALFAPTPNPEEVAKELEKASENSEPEAANKPELEKSETR